MNTYIKAGVALVGHGLRELMQVVFILSMGMLTYYLVKGLPIDHMIAIALSVGAGLLAAYGIYGSSYVAALAEMSDTKTVNNDFFNDDSNHYQYDDSFDDDFARKMNPVYSYEIDNINNGQE